MTQETLTWYGHSNFVIHCGSCSLAIDPFFTGNPLCPVSINDIKLPDYTLVTHLHQDHAGDAIRMCQQGSTLVTIVGIGEALIAAGVPPQHVINGIGFNIGGTMTVDGVDITMTEAFHTSEAGAPAGFIIRLPSGFTIYHAGDTGIFANMATWGRLYAIDLALLPIGGVFTMDAQQAALATTLLQAKAVIPMHYGTFPLLSKNADSFTQELRAVNPDCQCMIMRPGETLCLPFAD